MNIFDLPVHPAADVFPMLDKDELADLAADIEQNGLQHPVVVGEVDGQMMLIDGRNRLAACGMVGIEPEVKQLNGHDPEALILSENIMRRHMTKGQRAMAVAMMYPEPGTAGRGEKNSSKIKEFKMDGYISQARTVLKYTPEYTDSVLAGAKSLSEAYEEAKQRKNAGNDDTEKLEWLKSASADLADKVVEGELTLPGAIAEHHERERIARANREAGHRNLRDGIYGFGTFFMNAERIDEAVTLLTDYRADFEEISARDSSEAITYLKAISTNVQTLINSLEKQL